MCVDAIAAELSGIDWFEFAKLTRETPYATQVTLHPHYRTFIGQLTALVMSEVDFKSTKSLHGLAELMIAEIDTIITPEWVNCAVNHLDDRSCTVTAEMAACFPVVASADSQNLDGMLSEDSPDNKNLTLDHEKVLQFVILRSSYCWHALSEIMPCTTPIVLNMPSDITLIAATEGPLKDASHRRMFWTSLWNLCSTGDWTADDFHTKLPELLNESVSLIPGRKSLQPVLPAAAPAAEVAPKTATPAVSPAQAAPQPVGIDLTMECLHDCFKTVLHTPSGIGKHSGKSVMRLMSLKARAEEALFMEGRDTMTGCGVVSMKDDGSLFCNSMPELLRLPFWGKAAAIIF